MTIKISLTVHEAAKYQYMQNERTCSSMLSLWHDEEGDSRAERDELSRDVALLAA